MMPLALATGEVRVRGHLRLFTAVGRLEGRMRQAQAVDGCLLRPGGEDRGDHPDLKLFFERSFAESWDKSLEKLKTLVEAEAPATSRGRSSPASGRSRRLRGAGAASSTRGVRGARSSGRDDLRLWRIPRAAVIVIPSGRL